MMARCEDGKRVKPLEWSEIERDRGDGQTDKHGEWEAPSIVGVYAINISTCGDMHAPWEVFDGGDSKLGNFVTLEAAKAAAQADYEARTLSALSSPASSSPAEAEALPDGMDAVREAKSREVAELIERLEAAAEITGDDLLRDAITVIQVQATALSVSPQAGAMKLLRRFVYHERGIMADLRSAHSNRGPGASSFMRENDRDQYEALEKLFADARAALRSAPAPEDRT